MARLRQARAFGFGAGMSTQRQSYRPDHRPKCLVVVDDTAEWDRAVYYASRWAVRVGGSLVMLRVIEILDKNQQWLGVADVMRAEAIEVAELALDRAAGRANGVAGITPERVIREGDTIVQLRKAIDEDVDITMLVLAASDGPEGPGPIVTAMVRHLGSFPVPVVMVASSLTDDDIDALA
jgi:nucleotide-binding universal stress UspA family protein